MKPIAIEEHDKGEHQEDILYIAQNMRAVDKLEVKAFGYTDYLEAIQKSIDNSQISFIAKGNTPLCVFGLSKYKHEQGRIVWLLATKDIKGYKKEFLKHSYLILSYWFKEFGPMYNYISIENKNSIRWFKWLRANFSEPFFIGQDKFMQFILDERSF